MELLKSTAQQRANIILCTTGGGSSGLLQIDFWPSTGNLCIDISEGGKSSQIKTPFSLQKEKMYTITIVMKGSKFSVTAKKVGDGGGSWEKSHSGVGMVPRKAYENVKLYASSPSVSLKLLCTPLTRMPAFTITLYSPTPYPIHLNTTIGRSSGSEALVPLLQKSYQE